MTSDSECNMVRPSIPFGFIQDQWRPGTYTLAGAPAQEAVRRMIYDGEKFVDFDGFEGAAVLNELLQRRT